MPAEQLARHDPERHPQGVHRARELHLPARAGDAADHRPVRLLPRARARSGTRSRSPATTCARRAARRSRRWASRSPTRSPTCRRRIDAGLEVDEFGPRLAFFFNGHNNVFQEVAKFRAARRMWARIMRERFGAQGRALAEDALPHPDRRRHARRPAAARTTSCAWRSRASRRCAAARSRCTRTASTRRSRCRPSAPRGSRCAPSRSSPTSPAPPTPPTRSPAPTSSRRSPTRSRRGAQELIDKVEELGGSVQCIPFIRAEVEESAWGYEERYRQKQDIVVGVNEYVTDADRRGRDPARRPGVRAPAGRAARRRSRTDRDQDAVDARLEELRAGLRAATATCSTRCAPR